jgi:hypothetical protein
VRRFSELPAISKQELLNNNKKMKKYTSIQLTFKTGHQFCGIYWFIIIGGLLTLNIKN